MSSLRRRMMKKKSRNFRRNLGSSLKTKMTKRMIMTSLKIVMMKQTERKSLMTIKTTRKRVTSLMKVKTARTARTSLLTSLTLAVSTKIKIRLIQTRKWKSLIRYCRRKKYPHKCLNYKSQLKRQTKN